MKQKKFSVSNIKDLFNIIYSTEILMLLFVIGAMDIHIGHALI